MVLSVLHPKGGAENRDALKVDIVAIHGLNGNPVDTWTNQKTKAFWLQDYLPLDIAGARVMTFGYNADVAFGNSTADVIDHAKDLLSSLIDKRQENDELKRPMVFIAHSLGGIVVKQALFQARIESQYQSITENTVGIVFLGTPHRGSDKADYGKILANVATSVMNKPKPRLISALQSNSDSLMRLTSDFRHQLPNYKVVSFYETKPITMFSTLIVEKHSALLEVQGEDQIPVDANHRDMCKFQARDDPVYEKLFNRIRRMLKANDVGHFSDSLNPSNVYNKHYEVPHNVSSVFTGREDICQQLTKSCLPSRPVDNAPNQKRFVLYGLGGSGKTQVCLKFAQTHRESFWGIFWIDASSNETAEQGFLSIARSCGFEADFEAVKRWLSNYPDPWLLIIDNADDPSEDVSRYFPAGNRGTILLNTRNPDCGIHATVGSYQFGQMEPEEAITLLLKTTATPEPDISQEATRNLAAPVVKILGYLPLAIVHAGAVIRQKLYSMEEYCSVYSRRRKQLLSHQPVQARGDYKYTVYTTWEVSVNMIKEMGNKTADNAIEILQVFSFMHFDGISEEILKEARRQLQIFSFMQYDGYPEDFLKEVRRAMQRCRFSEWTLSHQLAILRDDDSKDWEPGPFREAVAVLLSFSLISIDAKNHISMHPLVHTWARDRLDEVEQKRLWRIAASTLAMSISWEYQSFDYNFRRSLLSHVGSCLSFFDGELFAVGEGESERLEIADKFAIVFLENGRWLNAMELEEKVLKAQKEILGDEHPDTLKSMNNLALSYSNLGRTQEAVELEEKALKAAKEILGDEDPNTLGLINNLAHHYSDLGRRQEALELEEKALEAQKKTLGDEHPDTLSSMNNLGLSYDNLGRMKEAVELKERALEVQKRILGDGHPHISVLLGSLATSYSNLGRRQEAIELREKVLKTRKETLGDEHPDTLASMHNLANSYDDFGRSQEALELREKILGAQKKTLGDEHPDTLRFMNNLAVSYIELGRKQEAIELKEKVLKTRKKILGDEHPDTLVSMNNLASCYSELGRKQEAVELEEKTLEARIRILGDEHLDTLDSMSNLAISYGDLGRWQEAIELEEKALEARKRIFDDEHPDTLRSMSNLAVSYSELGRRQESVELREKSLKARKKILGDEHPATLMSMNDLAASYSHLGRRQEAIELEEKALRAQKRILGEEHPRTLLLMSNLAACYSHLGRWQEALELEEKAFEARRRIFGDEHPDTQRSIRNLAIFLYRLNDSTEDTEQRVSSGSEALPTKPKNRRKRKSSLEKEEGREGGRERGGEKGRKKGRENGTENGTEKRGEQGEESGGSLFLDRTLPFPNLPTLQPPPYLDRTLPFPNLPTFQPPPFQGFSNLLPRFHRADTKAHSQFPSPTSPSE